MPGVKSPVEAPQQQPGRDRKQKLEGRPVMPPPAPHQGSVPRLPPEKGQPQGGNTVPVIREQPRPTTPHHIQPLHGRVEPPSSHTATPTATQPKSRDLNRGLDTGGRQPRQPPVQRQTETQRPPAKAQPPRTERPPAVQRPATTVTGETTSRPPGQPASRQAPGSNRAR